ncbi:glycosyltransferase family 2 protein [Paralcaligenes ureilyticus]|uniref:Glycosyltransferase involved in cell wall biosynthesis n=1 Tax=Paralcaligenes ureilyticus TaxID=627131 RepID=A0A4R3MBZ2_9BURK|nr:glycosyltransferase family 2 protein [Paralcaligenes ureilyticus]TCT10886.1 glycosyltransferase involved in cell wall biosynthesis [Paralcaligenes ureilyticus]
MPPPSSISCVVPCLNEEANLKVLLPGLIAALKALAPAFEIIVVDDGSSDGTSHTLAGWAQEHPQVVYLQLSRNFGKEAALSAGLEAARGQVVVCMDADLQHPPALISTMLERWQEGVEMVYAVRATRDDESVFKRLGTKLFYKMMRTSGGPQVPENAGDFRLMDRAVVDALLMLPERNRFMKGLFAWVGFRAEPIYYSPPERLHGTTRFKPIKLFRFAIDGITAFTTWPLRLLSVSGASLSVVSFAYGLYVVINHWLYGDPVQGWTTLITVVLFFAGVNLLSIGVLGEYVARIFGEVKNRPVYLLRQRVGAGLDDVPMPSAVKGQRLGR